MTALRQKMIEDMQLRGFADRTQEAYLSAVGQLAKHYRKSPDQIDEEELRQYFLFLKNEKQAARATCTIYKHFSGFGFILPPSRVPTPPPVTQAVRRIERPEIEARDKCSDRKDATYVVDK